MKVYVHYGPDDVWGLYSNDKGILALNVHSQTLIRSPKQEKGY